MKTIVESKELIDRLWGRQTVHQEGIYRLMRYVLRVDDEGKVLLHNTVTGRLAVLEPEEAEALDRLPLKAEPVLEQLIAERYLVPEDCDEHDQVMKLRRVLNRLLAPGNSDLQGISSYTILPTTACNARCYYCFENGVRPVTMSEQTADAVVRFIAGHCGEEKKVSIRWFGGEPTVASNRIDQICRGLEEHGISYTSSITTNGYLFDEEMVSRAKALWHLQDSMITVDGTEENYNAIKSYVGVKDNPYRRVLRNVGLLLEQGIGVALRMNFDQGNAEDFPNFLEEVGERFGGNRLLQVYSFPIKGEYPDKSGRVCHASEAWLEKKLVELNDKARETGLFRNKKDLPSLNYNSCNAGTPSFMVITPEGRLGRCTGIFSREDQIVGNVADGVTDPDYCKAWNHFADPARCRDCPLFPDCVLIENCPGIDRCFRAETCRQYEETIKHIYRMHVKNDENSKEDRFYDFSGT